MSSSSSRTSGRLGLTDADTVAAVGPARSTPARVPTRPTARTIGTAAFPVVPGSVCAPPAPIDTVDQNVFATLESDLPSGGSPNASMDTPIASWAPSPGFALPSPLAPPVLGYSSPALTKTTVTPQGLAAAPFLSTAVEFTLLPPGPCSPPPSPHSSLSGDADTSVLAAVQAAGATHSFPAMLDGASGRHSIRFTMIVTTTLPASAQNAVIVDQIALPERLLTRPARLATGSQPDLAALKNDAQVRRPILRYSSSWSTRMASP